MTALSKAALKALWIAKFQPTSANFSDMIDSWADYSVSLSALGSLLDGGGTGLVRSYGSGTTSFTQITNLGAQILSATTTAAAQSVLGAGVFGAVIFTAATTAAAVSVLGAGAVGAQIFAAATTAQVTAITGAGLAAATTAQAQAAILNTVSMTPANSKDHPGVAKAWVNFDGVTTVSVRASYNVSSVVRNGTGDYTIVFIVPFATGAYNGVGFCDQSQGGTGDPRGLNIVTTTAGGMRILCAVAGPTANDCEYVAMTFFGTQ